jgi:hypothetical protein
MPISVQCPACQAKLSAPDTAAGKRVKCPKCQGAIAIPGVSIPVAAAPLAAKPAPAGVPVASAPKMAVPAASAPVAAAALPAAAPAKGGLPVLVIVLGVGILGGGMLLLGAIGIGAYVLMASGAPEGLPADPAAAVAGGPTAPPPVAAPPAPAPTPVQAAPQPTTAPSVNWVAHDNADKGFQAAFPGGEPQSIDPLAEIKDESQRELAAAMMKEWTVLGVTHAGRKYTLTAAPLNLGGAPPEVYLDRMSVGLGAIHQGFSVDPQPPSDKSAPIRDYVLKKRDAAKLLRVIAANGHVYQLLIEGESGLTFSDPTAEEFFERFACAGVAGVPVASGAPSDGKAAPEEAPEVPDGIDWRSFQGQKIAFTIRFPGVTPQEEDPLAIIIEDSRPHTQHNWQRDGVVAESYSAEIDGRRYGITAFRDPNLREKGRIRFTPQMESLLRTFAQDLYRDVRNYGFRTRNPATTLKVSVSTVMVLPGGNKAFVRQAHLGHYGFVIRVEGPADIDDLDPQIHKFFDSLQPPPDAEPIPLNVKPLPGPGGKTKTKTKQK